MNRVNSLDPPGMQSPLIQQNYNQLLSQKRKLEDEVFQMGKELRQVSSYMTKSLIDEKKGRLILKRDST